MNAIFTGVLQKHNEKFQVVSLDLEQVPQALELQVRVHEGMSHKEWLVEDTEKELKDALKSGGVLFGVKNSKNELIATRFIRIPRESRSNLAYDLSFPVDLHSVVQLQSTVVDPAYRGNNLQAITLMVAEEFARDNKYEHLVCTVAPTNIYSLYNIMMGGLSIKALKKKYQEKTDGGVWRFVLHKELKEREVKPVMRKIDIHFEQLELQTKLIEKGFIGTNVCREQHRISYVR
ncbi:hypothetical protein [Guggenheimella bovis]